MTDIYSTQAGMASLAEDRTKLIHVDSPNVTYSEEEINSKVLCLLPLLTLTGPCSSTVATLTARFRVLFLVRARPQCTSSPGTKNTRETAFHQLLLFESLDGLHRWAHGMASCVVVYSDI